MKLLPLTHKSLLIILFLSFFSFGFAQKKQDKKIIYSKNIAEIENFLKTSHPEDPRNIVLRKRLINLKNEAWTKGKANAKPMEARPWIVEIPKSVLKNGLQPNEAEEFAKLINESDTQHKEKTVKLLNTLFNQDISSDEAMLLVKNDSDCDIILRLVGNGAYNLPIPAHNSNAMVIKKGLYHLNSNVCNIKYESEKAFTKSFMIVLKNPESAQ